ncbi:unnamed protein product, partial [Amoebophrya sp. A120]|eukprot:GSA120T00009027001.1
MEARKRSLQQLIDLTIPKDGIKALPLFQIADAAMIEAVASEDQAKKFEATVDRKKQAIQQKL